MRRYLIILIISIYTFIYPEKPINLTIARKQVEHYYESGNLEQEIRTILAEAWQYLKEIKPTKDSVVIIDIDETALSNYQYFKIMQFNKGGETAFCQWKSLAQLPAITPVLHFYNQLIKHGFKIMFISCRGQELYESTCKNLQQVGYETFERLILRTEKDKLMPFYEYKKQKRAELNHEGYNIVACIGDQWSDLQGEYTGLKIKIPNYILHE